METKQPSGLAPEDSSAFMKMSVASCAIVVSTYGTHKTRTRSSLAKPSIPLHRAQCARCSGPGLHARLGRLRRQSVPQDGSEKKCYFFSDPRVLRLQIVARSQRKHQHFLWSRCGRAFECATRWRHQVTQPCRAHWYGSLLIICHRCAPCGSGCTANGPRIECSR